MNQVKVVLILLLFLSIAVGTVAWRRASTYPQGETRTLTRIGAIGFLGGALAFAVALAITLL